MPTARKKKKTPAKRATKSPKAVGASAATNRGGSKTRGSAKKRSGAKTPVKKQARKAPAKKATASKARTKSTSKKTSAAKAPRTKRSPRGKAATRPNQPEDGASAAASTTDPSAAAQAGADALERQPLGKRSFGLRGAAPWVARHAAKHAAELRARNAQPPPPGSARATLRVPPEAAQIKEKIAQLHQVLRKLRSLSRRLEANFFEIGEMLADIQRRELHVAKGFSTFEAFLDRETDVGRSTGLRLIRIVHTFQRETAYDYGLERLTAALAALDGELTTGSPSQPSSRSFSSTALPTKPPIRYGD